MTDINSQAHILGIGTPIIDCVINVSDDFLAELPGLKGGAAPIDYPTFQELIKKSDAQPTLVLGGSTTNTLKGLAHLGYPCALSGKIGSDEAGKKFLLEIEKLNIISHLSYSNHPTAQVLCFISPDSERTMRAFLGAGTDMKPQDLSSKIFNGINLVHIEGYLLNYGELAHQAMKLAKQAGAKISFDISSKEIAKQYSNVLFSLIESYVDILFANEEESFALTGKSPEESCEYLKNLCEVAVIKMGKDGNWAATKNEKVFQPAHKVKAIDTTGAGDLFATGFLHGYLSDQSLAHCSKYGALIASEVVQVPGADLSDKTWQTIIYKLQEI